MTVSPTTLLPLPLLLRWRGLSSLQSRDSSRLFFSSTAQAFVNKQLTRNWLCFFFLLLSQFAPANAQQHMLDHVLPRGGTQGTTVEVTLYGQYLTNPKEILFYDKGIKATILPPAATPEKEVKARLDISKDAAPGEH